MSIHGLEKLFQPKSIALVGMQDDSAGIGRIVRDNLAAAGFKGSVFSIDAGGADADSRSRSQVLRQLADPVDLAVLAAPLEQTPDLVHDCVRLGVGAAIILSGGGREVGERGLRLEERILAAARAGGMRILGPNSSGLVNLHANLNISPARDLPQKGGLAFLSQSGAVGSAILDYAIRERIGFSHFVSLGSMLDVDFGDVIDYLGGDGRVASILLYAEQLSRIRSFMSAARAVSRVKPIIALKSGRTPAGERAAASHTGAMSSADDIYDTALQRSGILRVKTFQELFDCAELLAKQPRPLKPGLVILSNAGGPAVMAADALSDYGARPAELSADVIARLDCILPPRWSRANPVDLLEDADARRYLAAAEIVLDARETHGLLIMLAPQALTDPTAVAEALVASSKARRVPLITAWLGGRAVEKGRETLNRHGIPTYSSPERAVRAFMDLYHYGRNVELLQQVPGKFTKKLEFDRDRAREIITRQLQCAEHWLNESDAKQLLAAYGIPVNPTHPAADPEEAARLARDLGFPVALKIDASGMMHKSETGGVVLNLTSPDEVCEAFRSIRENHDRLGTGTVFRGVTVQTMKPACGYELILGIKNDPHFGPVLLFGAGGRLTEIVRDRALALPPLNRLLARRMIESTRIAAALRGYRGCAAANETRLEEILMRLSQLCVDFAEIGEVDINPLIAVQDDFCAVDARIRLQPAHSAPHMHLVISPYPAHLESELELPELGTLTVRPIRPEDAPLLTALFGRLSQKSIYYRFFSPLKELPPGMLARFTQIDYDREIALVAVRGPEHQEEMLAVARVIQYIDPREAEFAVLVGDPWHGKGIGATLLKRCLKIARQRNVKSVWATVLADNTQMLALGRKLHFRIKRIPESSEYELHLDLDQLPEDALA